MQDQTEDDSEISNSLHASLVLVPVDLTDSPPPMQAVTLRGIVVVHQHETTGQTGCPLLVVWCVYA